MPAKGSPKRNRTLGGGSPLAAPPTTARTPATAAPVHQDRYHPILVF